MAKFYGVTGRATARAQDSLAAAVDEVAFLDRKDPAKCVTFQSEKLRSTWYVYADQVTLDGDRHGAPTDWFAFITAEDS